MEMWTEEWLDEELSTPSEALIEDLKTLEGDIMILGAGGKVGPTLSVMLRRACTKSGVSRKVYAVSRFTDPFVVSLLEREQVETISCDLTDEAQIATLPRVEKVELLPYHTLGVHKYQTLGIPYPLEGVPPMNKTTLEPWNRQLNEACCRNTDN